ncbi:nucleotidyltransferase domain-containing protein [Leucothrix arctica]
MEAFPYLSLATLFGSVATNKAHYKSDIDLAVRAKKALRLSKI